VAVAVASCPVVASSLGAVPPLGVPPCVVAALFDAFAPDTTTLVCVIGPSSPGLLMRTETTTFVGCSCVAELVDEAAWSVAALSAGIGAAWSGDSESAACTAVAGVAAALATIPPYAQPATRTRISARERRRGGRSRRLRTQRVERRIAVKSEKSVTYALCRSQDSFSKELT
jgi:hypothetical protein